MAILAILGGFACLGASVWLMKHIQRRLGLGDFERLPSHDQLDDRSQWQLNLFFAAFAVGVFLLIWGFSR